MSSAATNPIVDDRGATFTWRGAAPPPVVIGSWCDWDPERGLRPRRGGAGTWTARVDLPADAYVEYALLVDGVKVPDPLNPNTVDNGVGSRNHRFWMPKAPRRALALARRRVPRGAVTHGTVGLGWLAAPPLDRRMALYLPHGAGDDAIRRHLPLLVVLDGLDYLRRGRLARLLDALIADGSMAPVAACFIDDAGPARASEYAANDFTLTALAELVVPAAVERLGLEPQLGVGGASGRATILGSSLGGLMAVHAGVRRPDLFGGVIAQSTAALVEDLTVRGRTVPRGHSTLLALIEATPAPPIRLWLDVGALEDLAEPNDRLVEVLSRRGFDLTYRPFPGGHDQTSWAESLVDALPAMFPPAVNPA